jgi:hypothetical protein
MGNRFKEWQHPEFLEYLNITEKEFWEVIDFYRNLSPHIWTKVNGE